MESIANETDLGPRFQQLQKNNRKISLFMPERQKRGRRKKMLFCRNVCMTIVTSPLAKFE